jgi:hypothetical protein
MVADSRSAGREVRLNIEFSLTPEKLKDVLQCVPVHLVGRAKLCLESGEVMARATRAEIREIRRLFQSEQYGGRP